MSKFTLQLRWYIENGGEVFDFNYPIFDEAYRPILEQKFIDHYYFREIGLETIGQFKHFLKSKLNRIMPYYNQLYETEGLVNKDNYNINLDNTITQTRTTEQDAENTGTSNTNMNTNTNTEESGNQTQNNTNQSVYSDTPQARLSGNLDYATNMTDDEGQSLLENESTGTQSTTGSEDVTSQTSGKIKTVDEYVEHLLGNASMRYNADILMEWRKSFLNIDEQVIQECNDLFMNIWE